MTWNGRWNTNMCYNGLPQQIKKEIHILQNNPTNCKHKLPWSTLAYTNSKRSLCIPRYTRSPNTKMENPNTYNNYIKQFKDLT